MNRNHFLVAATVLFFVVVGFMMSHLPGPSESSTDQPEETKPVDEITQRVPSDAPLVSHNSPRLDPSRTGVGRKNYDTGIRNDGRIQTTEEGKRIATEGLEMAKQLHTGNSSVEEDLDYLDQILGLYRLTFAENPIAGDNQMVMEALMGNNPAKLVVFPEDHPDLDATGQLLDRWGTPYFFHPLSGAEMEIFSAGPDRRFNTSDDVHRSQRDGQPLTGQDQFFDPNVDL